MQFARKSQICKPQVPLTIICFVNEFKEPQITLLKDIPRKIKSHSLWPVGKLNSHFYYLVREKFPASLTHYHIEIDFWLPTNYSWNRETTVVNLKSFRFDWVQLNIFLSNHSLEFDCVKKQKTHSTILFSGPHLLTFHSFSIVEVLRDINLVLRPQLLLYARFLPGTFLYRSLCAALLSFWHCHIQKDLRIWLCSQKDLPIWLCVSLCMP